MLHSAFLFISVCCLSGCRPPTSTNMNVLSVSLQQPQSGGAAAVADTHTAAIATPLRQVGVVGTPEPSPRQKSMAEEADALFDDDDDDDDDDED
jgi:hypothetical protein